MTWHRVLKVYIQQCCVSILVCSAGRQGEVTVLGSIFCMNEIATIPTCTGIVTLQV